MASALRIDNPPQPATECSHHAFNAYETIGAGIDPTTTERGKCCSCQEWLERETYWASRSEVHITERPLDPATIARLLREQNVEMFV